MTFNALLELAALIFGAALLYASVGHGGGSGYIAALALSGVAPALMKPTALTLNLFVASIGTWKFYRAGAFSWQLFWPFALASVPCAFLGGVLTLPGRIYKIVVGLVLLYSAVRLLLATRQSESRAVHAPPLWIALLAGAGIGLLSGLTGVGGGIFLSPLLLLMGWAQMRPTAGVSAAFILVNSVAGLAGHVSHGLSLPPYLPWLVIAAVAGGWLGSEFGSRRLSSLNLRRLLGVVLLVAGGKMLLV